MSLVLQIVLALVGLSVVALILSIVPAVLQLRRNADRLTDTVESLTGEVTTLAQEMRATIEQVNDLSTRVARQWDSVEATVGTVRGWASRADAVVQEVDAAIAPPILQTARAVGLVRVGVTAFLQALTRGGHRTDGQGGATKPDDPAADGSAARREEGS